jgi:hypothetical protein
MLSTIIFIITRGWHNRPGVAAVPIVSQKKKKKLRYIKGGEFLIKHLVTTRRKLFPWRRVILDNNKTLPSSLFHET